MSLINTLAVLEATRSGRAQPLTTVRHRHLAGRPMVVVPLTTAGEAGAPLGALVGTDRDAPRLLSVAQPRDRDLRFAFLAELASCVLPYLDSYADDTEPAERNETDPETGKRVKVEVELCRDAPQLIVPSRAGIEYVRLLGRSMRFRRTAEQDPDTPYPAPPHIPLLGRWLTHYGERARVPGSSLLLAATDLLGRHWATGQSSLEDQHLGALLAWIDPRDGAVGGAEAALRAETGRDAGGQLLCPPAGPATDPAFDNALLAPAIDAYDLARQRFAAAEDGMSADALLGELSAAERRIRELLTAQLRPTWDSVWQALDRLRTLPEGVRAGERWTRDRWSYTGHRDRVRAGEPPQPRLDSAVGAAQKLASRETEQARLEAQEALDDPLVMASRRLSGEAFSSEVVGIEMSWSEGKRPSPRPLVSVTTTDLPQLGGGGDERVKVYRSLDGKAQTAEFVRRVGRAEHVEHGGLVEHGEHAEHVQHGEHGEHLQRAGQAGRTGQGGQTGQGGADLLVLRVVNGMGRSKEPAPGTVPEVGDRICWTLFEHEQRGGPQLPDPEETPWTHGGPPGGPDGAADGATGAATTGASAAATAGPTTGAATGGPTLAEAPDPVTPEDLL